MLLKLHFPKFATRVYSLHSILIYCIRLLEQTIKEYDNYYYVDPMRCQLMTFVSTKNSLASCRLYMARLKAVSITVIYLYMAIQEVKLVCLKPFEFSGLSRSCRMKPRLPTPSRSESKVELAKQRTGCVSLVVLSFGSDYERMPYLWSVLDDRMVTLSTLNMLSIGTV